MNFSNPVIVMESKSLFDKAKYLCGNEISNCSPCSSNELVYMDDEEESHIIPLSNKIDNEEEFEHHPLDVKIEPEEILSSSLSSPDIFRCTIKEMDTQECISIESCENLDAHSMVYDHEEQFEIVAPKPPLEISDDRIPDIINNNHDHSYSQSQNLNETTFCDDIIQDILAESETGYSVGALKLLENYTKFMKNNVITEDEQSSQIAQYLKQMDLTLQKLQAKQKKEPISNENHMNNQTVPLPKLEDVKQEQKNKELTSDVKNLEIKAEPESTNIAEVITCLQQPSVKEATNCNKESIEVKSEFSAENVEKLKAYTERVQISAKKTIETCQNLLEAIFISPDDIDNGKQKLSTAMNDLMTELDLVLNEINFKKKKKKLKEFSDMEDEDEHLPEEKFGKSRNFNSSKRHNIAEQNKSSSDTEETDEEIRKLCDFGSLNKQKSGDRNKITNGIHKSEKEKVKKKKIKKQKESSCDTSDSYSDSMLSNTSNSSHVDFGMKTDDELNKNSSSSSDGEEKMRERIEKQAKNNLLLSSESDEKSYHTSESSLFDSSDDDDETTKKKIQKESKKSSDDSFNDNDLEVPETTPKESNVSIEDLKNNKTKIDNKHDNETEMDNLPKKPKKKARASSFEREIFSKKFLADIDDDDDQVTKESLNKKIKSNKLPSSENECSIKLDLTNEVLDASAFDEDRSDKQAVVELEKYLKKVANQPEKNSPAQPVTIDLSKVKQQPVEPSKKSNANEQFDPSVLDDITCISLSSESDSEISSTHTAEGTGRRRKQLTEEELKEETKKAKKDENERVKKLEEKSSRLTQFLTQRLSQTDMTEELILDYNEEKNLEIKVHQLLVKHLKPHQKEGVQFMFDNCYGPINDVKPNNGSGCILAHCMGLGKTLQLITLLHTVIRYDELYTKRILVICPKSTILNWGEEFKKWLKGIECEKGKRLIVKYMEENLKIDQKIKQLEEWYECNNPSVFLINYETFRILANWSGSNKRNKTSIPEETVKKYQARIKKCLLDPGPHLVVCDEGHIIKNQKGKTNLAVTKITTKRRIILTGTPVQNALHEYYAMVQWIKPNLLGTAHEFNVIYANPIKDGQNKDSTSEEIKKMKQKSYVLNKNLSKFVQRKDASVLKEFLPIKHEYVISVPLTPVQEELYNFYLRENRNDQMGKMLLPHYTALRKIWTHPKVLKYAYERAKKGDIKFTSNKKQQKTSSNAFNEDGEGEEPDDVHDTSQGLTAVTNDWWANMITPEDIESIFASHKMRLLFEILKITEQKNEKILIFSSFVAVLDCIEQFMKAISNQDNNPNASRYGYDLYKTRWELGKDYYRLDGSTPKNARQYMINEFNRPGSTPRCFLISAKAGGVGINLTAANRCVIIDTSWNPANDNQNIFRIYRLGQTQTCYVYRFVAASTMEERVYSRSVTKEAMSHRVVEKKQIARHYVKDELSELFIEYKLKPREGTPNFPKDELLRFLLLKLPNSTYNFHEHDSLLENKPEDDLDEDEKKEAWQSYITESTNPYRMNNLSANGNSSTTLTKNIMNSSWLMNGMSTNGLDVSGLNSSFFPMSSNFFASDLFKRIGTYDALNLYPSSSLNLSSSTTATTSSLMSSLLYGHTPISALGNMASSSSVAASYSANNIPPATNSIFAQPGSSLTTTSSALSSPSSLLLPSQNLKKLNADNFRKKNISKSGKKLQQTTDPLQISKNSSKNLSILPDNVHSPKQSVIPKTPSNSNLVIASARSLNDGTSARTSIVQKKFPNTPSTSSSLLKNSTSIANKQNNPKTSLKQGSSMLKPLHQQQPSPMQNTQKVSAKSHLTSNAQKSPQQLSVQRIPSATNLHQKLPSSKITNPQNASSSQLKSQKAPLLLSDFRKISSSNIPKIPSNNKTSSNSSFLKQKPIQTPNPVSPSTTASIIRQLENNQTSLIDTSKNTNMLQKSPQNLNSSNNSISIIRLDKTPSGNSLSARPSLQSSTIVPNISLQQNSVNLKSPLKVPTPQSLTQQAQKRKSEPNQSLFGPNFKNKKIKLNPNHHRLTSSSSNNETIVELE